MNRTYPPGIRPRPRFVMPEADLPDLTPDDTCPAARRRAQSRPYQIEEPMFQRATKRQARLRLALIGPAGSGKTYTALNIATAMGGRIALLDTERGSASKYSDLFTFDSCEPENHHPQRYMDAIAAAEQAGYDILIIDSLSHAWNGRDGALELVDKVAKRQQTTNTFGAWRDVTPLHNALIDAMTGARLHMIATLRTKMEYVQEKDERGKTVIRKVGMQPIQRDGLEYEFDIVGDLDSENTLIIGKTRCPALAGLVFPKAGQELADTLNVWLRDGAASPETLMLTLRDMRGQLHAAGGSVPELTVAQVRAMTALELEHAIEDTRARLTQARTAKHAA